MHKLISAFGVFVFAGALLAQSPFAGTWKLDAAKTKYTTGEPSKDVTLVIEESGDNLQVTATGTNADGSPLSIKYTVPIKGGDGTVQDGPYDAIHARRISDSVRENTYMKSGKQVTTRRWVVSKDGKTMTSNVKGMGATGKMVAGTDVFDKQ
jgi:hypothetical protein